MSDLQVIGVVDIWLEHDGRFLMLHRSKDRKVYPDCWAFVGGGMQPGESGDPAAACLRELREETGLAPEDVAGMALRYVIVTKKGDLIFNHYVFIGRALRTDVADCDEGRLEWVDRGRVPGLKMTDYIRSLVAHYFAVGEKGGLYMGRSDADGKLVFEAFNENFG